MTHSPLSLRYAVGSETGAFRSRNEDSAFASPRLLAVADGMGGHAHGEVASAAVIGVIEEVDERVRRSPPADPMAVLSVTVAKALRRITEQAEQDAELTLMGSTLTVLMWDGVGFTLAHVGDSRGYLLRDGDMRQITRDHTLVQSLVDEGKITEVEAADHPRRSMLMRALQAGGSAEPDLMPMAAEVGDRVLLCSDGISSFVGADRVGELLSLGSPEEAVGALIAEAVRCQSQDNATCVVADVVEGVALREKMLAGSAANQSRPGKLARWTRILRR